MLYVIPNWCWLHPDEHRTAGGCWGISCGLISKDYCKNCESFGDFLDLGKDI